MNAVNVCTMPGQTHFFASDYGYYSKSNVESQQLYGELLLNVNKYFVDNTYNLTVNAGANFEIMITNQTTLVVN